MIPRILSVVVVAAYCVAGWGQAVRPHHPGDVVIIGIAALIPLALIWFPERIGEMKWLAMGRGVSAMSVRESPGCAVAAMGWILLALPALIWLLQR